MAPIARVVLGGTFDHLHVGHQALLATAFRERGTVAIGLTTDAYLRAHPKPLAARILPYARRRRALRDWLGRQFPRRSWLVVPLSDPYGRSTAPGARVLVASVETRRGARAVNRERRRKGLPALRVVLVPLVLADDLAPVTSTRIRRGEIDANGRRVSSIRVGVKGSGPEELRALEAGLRSVFPRARVTARLVERPVSKSPRSAARDWSRDALSGNDLSFGVAPARGHSPRAVLSERSARVELFPKIVERPRDAKALARWIRPPTPRAARRPLRTKA